MPLRIKEKIMKYIKDKNFLRFLIPSMIGAFLFVTPINQGGNLTIPIAVFANALLDMMGDASTVIICGLISISSITTLVHKFVGIKFIKNNPKLDNLFSPSPFWFGVLTFTILVWCSNDRFCICNYVPYRFWS